MYLLVDLIFSAFFFFGHTAYLSTLFHERPSLGGYNTAIAYRLLVILCLLPAAFWYSAAALLANGHFDFHLLIGWRCGAGVRAASIPWEKQMVSIDVIVWCYSFTEWVHHCTPVAGVNTYKVPFKIRTLNIQSQQTMTTMFAFTMQCIIMLNMQSTTQMNPINN